MATRLTRLLDAVVTDPGQRISTVGLVDDAERNDSLVPWGGVPLVGARGH